MIIHRQSEGGSFPPGKSLELCFLEALGKVRVLFVSFCKDLFVDGKSIQIYSEKPTRNPGLSTVICASLTKSGGGFHLARTHTYTNFTHTLTHFNQATNSSSNFLRCPSGTVCLVFAKRQQHSLRPAGTIGTPRPAFPVAPRVRDRSRKSSSN